MVINKRLITSNQFKNNKNSFYSFAIKSILKYSNNSIVNAKIRIDGSGDRIFRKNFLSYLRKELNTKEKRVMENCKLVDSKKDVLIQMADMIAGSVRRSYDETVTDALIYKDIVKKHIEDEWLFK